MTVTTTTNMAMTSTNTKRSNTSTVIENSDHCMGWALRLQPTSEHGFAESVSLEIQHILQHRPHVLLTVLTLYHCTRYGGNNSSSQVEWEDQDVQISVSYRLPSPAELFTDPTALDTLHRTLNEDRQAVIAWAQHAHWHATAIPWEKTLQTAREWETVGTFHHPPTLGNTTYQLASCAPHVAAADKLRIANRVWWDEAAHCFMVTECSYQDFSLAPDYQRDRMDMTHQLLRHHCPCHAWTLPTPLSSILIGVDQEGQATAINLQFGNRMAIVHAYDETTATWHPLLFNTCLRAANAGLRAYVATHHPEPWIKLRTHIGRHNLTFLEDAHEDRYPRQLLFWDYPEPPNYDVMNRYSTVGTIVWTRLTSLEQCAMLFPSYVVECHWPDAPQHHVERYTGVLHRHGDKRHIRCVADRPR